MRRRTIWMTLAVCALAIGLLSACGKEAEQPPEESSPAVSVTPEEPSPEVPEQPVPAETPAPAETERALKESELREWETWLNADTVCQLFNAPFEEAGQVDLGVMFYDGAGGTGEIPAEELAALEAVAGEFQTDVVKVTVEEILECGWRVLGTELTRDRVRSGLAGWWYLKEYDAYYHTHGDTMRCTVACTGGTLNWADGTIRLTCVCSGQEDEVFEVGLSEQKDGYYLEYIRRGEN